MENKKYIGIIGGSSVSEEIYRLAEQTGSLIAQRNGIVVCGGLSGVMEAVAKGAKGANGTVIGILPGKQKDDANPFIDHIIPTGFGIARNMIIINTADILIAINGQYGTLSEIAFALNSNKKVITLKSQWDLENTIPADTPEEAVNIAFTLLDKMIRG